MPWTSTLTKNSGVFPAPTRDYINCQKPKNFFEETILFIIIIVFKKGLASLCCERKACHLGIHICAYATSVTSNWVREGRIMHILLIAILTNNKRKAERDRKTKRQTNKQTKRLAQQLNIFLYQASIISSRWIISFINARYNRIYLETHLS